MLATFSQIDMQQTTKPVQQHPIFSADSDSEAVRRWGAVFSVFGEELDRVLDHAMSSVPAVGDADTVDQAHCAARRYGALLSVMCNGSSRSQKSCTIYDCCDGVSVLLLQQQDATPQDVSQAMSSFEEEKTSMDEHVFSNLLSRGIRTFFDKNVSDPTGLVTVSVAGGDYMFMRSEERDAILQKLHVGTSADVY